MESKKDIVKTNQNIKVDINPKEYSVNKIEKKQNKIIKKDSETFHDEHGRLLFKPDDEYSVKSCCGSMCEVDKPFMEFIAKTIVSLSVLGFCFIQLTNGEQSEFASSTISLILGTYLGSTTASTKERKK